MDGENNGTPWWVTALVSSVLPLVGAAAVVWRLVRKIREQNIVIGAEASRVDLSIRQEKNRSAATEAWEVVDRLNKEFEKQTAKFNEVEKKCDDAIAAAESRERDAVVRASRCETEHSATRAILRVILAWAKSKKMPIPEGLEEQINDLVPGGSGLHRPISPQANESDRDTDH